MSFFILSQDNFSSTSHVSPSLERSLQSFCVTLSCHSVVVGFFFQRNNLNAHAFTYLTPISYMYFHELSRPGTLTFFFTFMCLTLWTKHIIIIHYTMYWIASSQAQGLHQNERWQLKLLEQFQLQKVEIPNETTPWSHIFITIQEDTGRKGIIPVQVAGC